MINTGFHFGIASEPYLGVVLDDKGKFLGVGLPLSIDRKQSHELLISPTSGQVTGVVYEQFDEGPADMFEIPVPQGRTTIEEFGGDRLEILREGQKTTIHGPNQGDYVIEEKDGKTRIHTPRRDYTAELRNGVVEIDTSNGKRYSVKSGQNSMEVDASSGRDYSLQKQGSETTISSNYDKQYRIRESSERVDIDAAYGTDYRITKSGDTLDVNASEGRDFKITARGSVLMLDASYGPSAKVTFPQ
ncbi:MAG: hypothetical protein HYU64_18545 [Armatimonadetes bacterium]|nr:hypothetical protein [Armatimonadota bacterium]